LIGRLLAALGRIPAWVWVSALLSLVLVGVTVVSQPPPLPGSFQVTGATVTRFSPQGEIEKKVSLPHIWDDEKPPWDGDARYRIEWPGELDTDQALALYLPRVGARFRVWLNGRMIGANSWDSPGYVDTSVVPHLVDLPTELVRPVNNLLEIEVRGQRLRKSGLSALNIGPKEPLEARQRRVYWWQVSATWMVAACSVLLALLAGLMWLQSRERVFGLLAAAAVAWAVRLGLTPMISPGMPFELWFYLHKLSFTMYCGFLYLFLWDLFDYRQGRIRTLVTGLLWMGPLWLAVTTVTGNYNLYRVWTGVLAVVSIVALTLMFRRARWGLDNNQRLMVVVGIVTLITGVRDFLVVQLGWRGDADLRWMTPGSLVFMLTLAWVLVQRTAGYAQQIGDLNRELVNRVRERESELRDAFDLIRDAEKRQVLEDERRRLTRDMHDGLGSQLVQALNVVRMGSNTDTAVVTAMLNHALEELRMTLDSLEPMEGDLPAILGTLRRRITPALQAAGIELDWQVEEVPAVPGMESRGVMHLFRCLQEIFANIIKHAQASRVTVRTWTDGDRAMLSVRDDGKGLGDGFRQGGRGLANIRIRAAELGATVAFDDAMPGTAVTFRFPASPALKESAHAA
jgi:signal transduction histidine kinase